MTGYLKIFKMISCDGYITLIREYFNYEILTFFSKKYWIHITILHLYFKNSFLTGQINCKFSLNEHLNKKFEFLKFYRNVIHF